MAVVGMTDRPLDAMGRPSMSLTEMLRGGHGWRPAPPPRHAPPAPVPLDALAAPRKGRPTVYAGIEFRSRLEARWACFFDRLRVRWVYEPFDGNRYTPDFLLHEFVEIDWPALAEIKPAVTQADYRAPIA